MSVARQRRKGSEPVLLKPVKLKKMETLLNLHPTGIDEREVVSACASLCVFASSSCVHVYVCILCVSVYVHVLACMCVCVCVCLPCSLPLFSDLLTF